MQVDSLDIFFTCGSLNLLMFKVCGITVISEIEFFNFCGTECVKQNQKDLKTN